MYTDLRNKIYECFPRKPAVNYKLSEAIIADDYGDESNAFEENWCAWDEIEDWQVARCDVLFSFAPANAIEYIIPRYMIFFLDEIENKIPVGAYKNASDVSGDNAVNYLKRIKDNDYRNSGFNETQIEVIELFLKAVT